MNRDNIQKSMEEVFGKKKAYHKILFTLVLLAIIAVFIFIFFPQLPFIPPGKTFKSEDVAFVSQGDLDFQAKVKNITGYDWTSFLNADGSEKAKTTALLFLANEIDALDDNFNFVNRSVGLRKSELPQRLNATDASKKNLLKLIENAKAVENVFSAKGLESAKTRANRLAVIQNFFNKYSLPEGEISSGAKGLFAEILGLTVDDYSRLISLMIVNYNLFLIE